MVVTRKEAEEAKKKAEAEAKKKEKQTSGGSSETQTEEETTTATKSVPEPTQKPPVTSSIPDTPSITPPEAKSPKAPDPKPEYYSLRVLILGVEKKYNNKDEGRFKRVDELPSLFFKRFDQLKEELISRLGKDNVEIWGARLSPQNQYYNVFLQLKIPYVVVDIEKIDDNYRRSIYGISSFIIGIIGLFASDSYLKFREEADKLKSSKEKHRLDLFNYRIKENDTPSGYEKKLKKKHFKMVFEIYNNAETIEYQNSQIEKKSKKKR